MFNARFPHWGAAVRASRLRAWACPLCLIVWLTFLSAPDAAVGQARRVRVGIYQNKPKIFLGEGGRPDGIFVELLDEIAAQEGWTLVYVPCEWDACLQALEEGQIDLMPDVAFSAERDMRYDFHQTPVLESWSRVYVPSGTSVNTYADLDGLKVAALHGSIQHQSLEKWMSGFGYQVTLAPTDSLEQAFALAAEGEADAAVANYLFGDFFYQDYGLIKTPIVFSPVTLYYTVAQGCNADLLEAIDRHLDTWIHESGSPYYSALGQWMEKEPAYRVPRFLVWVLGGILGSLVVAVGAIYVLRRQVRARTRHLEQANRKIRQFNAELEDRVQARTRELREAQEQLVQQEKLAVLGQLAAGVSHELRNPLGVVSNAVYYLHLILPDAGEKVGEYLGIIESETRAAQKIVADLLCFAEGRVGEPAPFSVPEWVENVLSLHPASSSVTVEQSFPADRPQACADPQQMAQALDNLVVNALQAMPDGGRLSLSAELRGEEIAVIVSDTGEGISAEHMPKIYEPLFTTKARGIGLGLPVCARLAESNGGRIEAQSEPGKGSTFTLFLPAVQEG